MTTASSPTYSGEYRHTMDVKNRVTFPARWRRAENEQFFIFPDRQNSCLVIMPQDEFNALGDRIALNSNISERSKRDYIRDLYSQSKDIIVDRQGRMLLPDDFCRKIALGTDVILAGCRTIIEVWNPEPFRTALAEKKSEADKIGLEVGF